MAASARRQGDRDDNAAARPAGPARRSRVISFEGRVVLVTGAGRGLGAAYARAFGERGAAVVVHDAGVERGGEGGDPAVADAVVGEIRAAGGTALASYENLESEDACVRVIESTVAEL